MHDISLTWKVVAPLRSGSTINNIDAIYPLSKPKYTTHCFRFYSHNPNISCTT